MPEENKQPAAELVINLLLKNKRNPLTIAVLAVTLGLIIIFIGKSFYYKNYDQAAEHNEDIQLFEDYPSNVESDKKQQFNKDNLRILDITGPSQLDLSR